MAEKISDFLTLKQLQNLKKHKYASTGESFIEPTMQIFWRKLIEYIPANWAPNSITAAGLLFNISATIILAWHSPDCLQEPPAWTFIYAACALFIYQTLDALDGKQARKLGCMSPLGELFDHGCDAISCGCMAISLCVTFRLGTHPAVMFWYCFLAKVLFYTAQWEAYVTGVLRFNYIDVTETQLAIMVCFILSGILGQGIYDVVLLDMITFKIALQIFFWAVGIKTWMTNLYTINSGGCGRRGTSCANSSIISPVIPFFMSIFWMHLVRMHCSDELYKENACVFLALMSCICAKTIMRIIVGHMTKNEIPLFFDWAYIGPLCLLGNAYLNFLLSEWIALYIALAFCMHDLIRYSSGICLQIADSLQIHIFKVSKMK